MLLVDFPGGGHLSIEFVEEAPDDDAARLGAWLELRADDPAAVFRRALEAGVPEVKLQGTRTTSWCLAVRCSRSCRQRDTLVLRWVRTKPTGALLPESARQPELLV
jgi:hypothetical protein